jgi:hypothetical protein
VTIDAILRLITVDIVRSHGRFHVGVSKEWWLLDADQCQSWLKRLQSIYGDEKDIVCCELSPS